MLNVGRDEFWDKMSEFAVKKLKETTEAGGTVGDYFTNLMHDALGDEAWNMPVGIEPESKEEVVGWLSHFSEVTGFDAESFVNDIWPDENEKIDEIDGGTDDDDEG